MKHISYVGKKVSIGIDVHVKNYHVTCVVEGKREKRATMAGRPEALLSYIANHFEGANVQTAYETGFSGFALHRLLEKAGIKNLVVHAAFVEVSSRDRVKTDKRDSEKLAIQLDSGRLRSVRIPSPEEEAARLLHRTREQLVQDRTAIKNQIQMRFYQFGYNLKVAKEKLTLSRVEDGLKWEHSPEFVKGVTALLAIWRALNGEIKKIEFEQKKQEAADIRNAVFDSVPGYGFQTRRVLSTEFGDMKQFPNERTLFSACGLTPCEYSSGEHERKGHISRQGNARVRHVLIESAWTAIREDRELKKNFETLATRIGKKRAIVAIARKLLGRARALFRKDELYESLSARKEKLAA